MILKESRYLSCDEWAAGIYSRGDEVDELALVLTVDLTVELRKPVGVSLQGRKGLRMSETHTHTQEAFLLIAILFILAINNIGHLRLD